MNQFTEKLKHILATCLPVSPQTDSALPARERILVALSGGADSTALLLALAQLANVHNWEIFACHVNHNLRGEESQGDEAFCRSLCHNLVIKLEVHQDKSLPDSALPKSKDLDLHFSEESLRERRYCFLFESAKRLAANYVFTAHTLDDQIETVLFRLVRGTGLKGLRGINLDSPLKKNIRLIRPLLSFTKEDCCHFLAENSQNFRRDSSNTDPKFARNYLRHKVIPLIEARFNNFALHIEQIRDIIEKEDIWIGQLTEEAISQLETVAGATNVWPIDLFNSYPLALRRRIVAEALGQRCIEPSFKRIDEIIQTSNIYTKKMLNKAQSAITLSSEWRIQFTNRAILWTNNQELVARQSLRTLMDRTFEPVIVRIPGNNLVLPCSRVLAIEDLSYLPFTDGPCDFPSANSAEALVDLSGVTLPLVLRLRRAQDFIQPLGMKERVRLKKYLHTHKSLPGKDFSHLAGLLPTASVFDKNAPTSATVVLADQKEVIWIPGIGLSEKVKVVTSPSHRLKWLPITTDSTNIA